METHPIVNSDPPPDKWNYTNHGTDWTMKKCDEASAAHMAISPIDVNTTYANPGSGTPHDCMHAKCYYDWSLYSGSFLPHYSKLEIEEDKTGGNPPDNK